jgi:hypothetical protein
MFFKDAFLPEFIFKPSKEFFKGDQIGIVDLDRPEP